MGLSEGLVESGGEVWNARLLGGASKCWRCACNGLAVSGTWGLDIHFMTRAARELSIPKSPELHH